MSKSSKKNGRPVVVRDKATYGPLVAKYRNLLVSAGEQWDAGHHEHEVSILAALRVLLVDRLLDRVTPLKSLRFTDSYIPLPADGEVLGGGLTLIRLGEGKSDVVPICAASSDPSRFRTTIFREWWDRDLAVRHGTDSWTRRFLVYEMANTDGVHIDAELDSDYAQLSGPVAGMTLGSADGERPVDGVAAASLRQIAWEVATTLDRLDLP